MLIRPKDKETLLRIFSKISVPAEVWAYGSRVNGTAHAGSDLDLVIRAGDGKPLSLPLLTGLCRQIQDSNVPILVELRDWARLPESFHQAIQQRHEVLYSNAGEASVKIPA